MQVDPSIFRSYDIRGIAGKEFSVEALEEYEKWYGKFPGITLNPETARAIGQAYGTTIRKKGGKQIVIGAELRQWGDVLKKHFMDGVRSTGTDVVDIGISLTPLVYFATEYFGFDGGVSVTGSHNVYFFNGFKLMGRHVEPIYGDELQSLASIVRNEAFFQDKPGDVESKNIWSTYKDYFLAHNKLKRRLKVVIDCGNGTAGRFAPQLFRELGCDVTDIFSEPDDTFPNHNPDPEDPYNLVLLGKEVVKTQADMGLAFDADGDRMGVVSENGEVVWGDKIILLFAKEILRKNPGGKIVYDVKCSYILEEFIKKFGGIPVMHKTGHAPIKDTMRKERDVAFAGELSGHFYFAGDYFRIDDGLYAAGKLLQIMSNYPGSVSSLFSEFPKTVLTPEIKLGCPDSRKNEIVESIKQSFKGKYPLIDIEGVRIVFTDKSWGLVRASNTGPLLSIRIEGVSEKELLGIKNILADELEKYPEIEDRLDRKNIASHTGRLGWV